MDRERLQLSQEWRGAAGDSFAANIYLFKVNNRNTRKRYAMFLKVTIKTPEQRQDVVLVFLLLILNK